MSEFNIEVDGGSSVRLPTAGKYCDRDIVVTATGGGVDEFFVAPISSAVYFKVMNITEEFKSISPGIYQKAIHMEEYYAPNAVLLDAAIGQSAFQECAALRIVHLPKARHFMHYTFRFCTGLKEVQMGSVGYPVTNIALYTFGGCTQSDLTIVVYVDAESIADIPTDVTIGAPWGATNATIIYRSATTGEEIEI